MLTKAIASLPHTIGQTIRYLFSGWRAKAITGITAVATVAIIIQLAYSNQELLLTLEWRLAPLWLLPMSFFIALKLVLGGWGWHLLVRQSTQFNIPRHNIKVWWASNLSRRIPGGIWYIASRAGMYDEHAVSKRAISATSVLELVFIVTSGAIVALTTSPFWVISRESTLTTYSWLLLILIPMGTILIHPRFIAWMWQKINKTTPIPHFRWQETASILTFYSVIWLMAGPMVYSIINIIYPLSAVYIPSLIGMWALSNIIATIGAFTIGGFGVRELSFALLLAQIIPTPVAIIVVLLVRVFWLIGELITGLLALVL
jgi:hypothetical protein